MTIASWPATIRQTPDYGWQETPQRNVVSYKPDVGPPKNRRRSTANGALATGQFSLTSAQYATLMSFYGTDLADGTLPFSWVHPLTGVTYSWTFEAEPQLTATAFDWNTVSISLRRLP
jgi:hypothetical protein